MKTILIIGGCWPTYTRGRQAANYTTYKFIESFLKKNKYNIYFQYFSDINETLSKYDNKDIKYLKKRGVKFLDPILIKNKKETFIYKIILFFRIILNYKNIYKGYRYRHQIIKNLENINFDFILTVWSEFATQAISDFGNVKIAYYGNIDHVIKKARWRILLFLNELNIINYFIKIFFFYPLFSFAHIQIMKKYDWVFNVAKNDSDYYLSKGIKTSYLPIMWHNKNDFNIKKIMIKRKKTLKRNEFLASVGSLEGTANMLGFITLSKLIYPQIKKNLLINKFKINIYGGGIMNKKIKNLFKNTNIIIKGFVNNLDNEYFKNLFTIIPQSMSFLKVGHTRVLHAWSLGSPIVAYKDLALSMPELKNNYNCLLSENADHFVKNMNMLINNKILQKKIINGGLKTLQTKYDPNFIINTVSKKLS
jgi:hypothetical protein